MTKCDCEKTKLLVMRPLAQGDAIGEYKSLYLWSRRDFLSVTAHRSYPAVIVYDLQALPIARPAQKA